MFIRINPYLCHLLTRYQSTIFPNHKSCVRKKGVPIVTTFLFDDTLLKDNSPLNVKIFEEYSKEWAEFVLLNRKNSSDVPAHEYDVVVGPIANDTVGLQMRRFILGYISIERMIEELRFKKPAIQYFFGTELAVGYLKKI